MPQAVSVRLNDEAMGALIKLQSQGISRSDAIRTALVDAAARLTDKAALAEEAAALEADEDDRVEMTAVADLMEQLRAPR